MRPKMEWRSASKDNYKSFKEQHPGVDISFSQFVAIIRAWNTLFMDTLISSGDQGRIPHGLGKPAIRKYKPTTKKKTREGVEYTKRPINWQKTKELGKYVYYLNFHTDGWQYFFQWRHQDCKLRSATIWMFEPARVHSRRLAQLLKDPESKLKNLYREADKRY